MRKIDIRNMPSGTMGLSRKAPRVPYAGDRLVYRETTLDPKSVNTLRDLAGGRIHRLF